MKNYIRKPTSIKKSQFSKKDFCKSSFCPKDYRELIVENSNLYDLENYIEKKFTGSEIGSNSYMKKSLFRFIKTVNINEYFTLDERVVEYCKPVGSKYPKKNDILIVKDGAGKGLGEVALYHYENKKNQDTLSAGLLCISVNESSRFYIYGMLKSQFFKDFVNVNTAQGSTIRHSKTEAYNFKVPFPTKVHNINPSNVEKLVAVLTQNIISKEKYIKEKIALIDKLIEEELKNNQNNKSNKYSFPKLSNLKSELRLDTGLYEKKFKINNSLIENYKNGSYKIPIEKFKSGSTPKIRIFNGLKYDYKWVTPTNIEDFGFYQPIEKISMPTAYNLKKDAILFINRTSKGKKGEFVGISCFYDYSYYGKGQHNQGIYRVEDYNKQEKLFITAFMNSRIMRKICGNISIGSKMKEMKSYDFSKLSFPNFSSNKKKEIVEHYYKDINKFKDISLDDYLNKSIKRNKKLGIFQLNKEIFELKLKLEKIIDYIIMNKKINIDDYL